ncbi:MAG: SAM-dependent methyltransferase [Desulfobacterales bacterium]|nr:MAG: SAM-dependent methyltransferase [Desulfobacterales bacterium]
MEKQYVNRREEEYDILFGVINRFIGYFTRQALPATTNDTTKEYPFVAMDTRQAYEQIRLARDFLIHAGSAPDHLSFIDIGCGIGNILLIAEMMGFNVFGIEKDSASLTTARQLVGEESVKETDIWDFTELSSFDIIYYFRPFCTKKAQLAFEQHIENSLKPGGILIANRKMGTSLDSGTRFSRLSPEWPVWHKNSHEEHITI